MIIRKCHERFVACKYWQRQLHIGEARRYLSTPASSQNQVIFSGIQPTGVPHIGNYLGALQQWVHLQQTATAGTKLFFSVVDLHAITTPQKAEDLRKRKLQMLATMLAVGLDPERSTLFYQSSVSPCYGI